jgi:hypothetical protein
MVLVLYGPNLGRGGFDPLLPDTQKRVQTIVDRMWKDLARFVGRESLTHSEGIQLLREWVKSLGVPPTFLKETIAADVLHPYFPDLTNFEEQLALVDTDEKFQAILLAQPEPSPEQVEKDLDLNSTLKMYTRSSEAPCRWLSG